MERNYDEFNFCTPLTDEQMSRISEIIESANPNRIIDWRDETTLWVWLEGKTLDDGQWSE
jgi:hypothetical protein